VIQISPEATNMALTCGNIRADARTRTANRPITSRVRYQLRHAGGAPTLANARSRATARDREYRADVPVLGGTGPLAAARGAFATTFRSRDLRRAQLAFFGAWAAEWAFTVALGVYAFNHGGAAAVGLVSVLRMLPSALLAPILTPYADRWPRERVLVVVSAVRAAATAGTAVLVAADGSVAVVYGLAALSTVAATLYRPAHSALLPSLCRTPYELAGANVVRGMLDSLATLVGPLVAAVLLSTSGVTAVLAAAAASSAWSAALMLPVRAETVSRPSPQMRPLADLVEGMRAVGGHRDMRLLFRLGVAQIFTRGALTVFSVVVALDLLGTGESGVGTLNAAVGVGAVAGSVAASLLVGTKRLARWFGLGVVLWGLPLTIVAVLANEPATLVLLAVIGIGNALVDIGLFTLMARLSSDTVMARVFGLLESNGALRFGAGAAVSPVVIDLLGLRGALVVVGLVGPVVTAASWPRLRRLDTAMVGLDQEVGLLRGVEMFAPLPLPIVEQLARGLEPVSVAAGRIVFTQNDVGDRFYVIEDGTVEVLGDGVQVTTLGPGEVFGEIALLRRVPRTATVRARTDLRLQSLTSDRFLFAVTGVPASAHQARAHVDERLDRFSPDPDKSQPPAP
jgi:MFS family permease